MPAAADEQFDYLGPLGLDAQAAQKLGAAALLELLRRKRKEWTQQATNPLYQQQARAHLERARQFETLLKDPAAIAAYLAFAEQRHQEQRKAQEAELRPLLLLAAGQVRELTETQLEVLRRIAQARGLALDLVLRLVRAEGLKIVDLPGAAAPRIPYREPAMDSALLSQVHAHVRVLGKKSFYDLLDLPRTSAPGRLVSVAQIQYARWSKTLPKTAEVVAWEKAAQAATTYLKDNEQKARYDAALWNAELDAYIEQIDLVLGRGQVSKEQWAQLNQIGVEQHGLSSDIAQQVLATRSALTGVSPSPPLQVTVQTSGQVQCLKCGRWNPAANGACAGCGGSLRSLCKNPDCRHPVSPSHKHCTACGLLLTRGVQYAALRQLIDECLEIGAAKQAREAIVMAEQIHAWEGSRELHQRALEQQQLLSRIRQAATEKRWSSVLADLPRLEELAPRLVATGVPSLDEVQRFTAMSRERLQRLAPTVNAAGAALMIQDLAEQWTDWPELMTARLVWSERLIAEQKYDVAAELLRPLLTQPGTAAPLVSRATQLRDRIEQLEQEQRQVQERVEEWTRAMSERRLFAAERILQQAEASVRQALPPEAISLLQRSLSQVRDSVEQLKRRQASGESHDVLLQAYQQQLEQCRDCRDALAALQTLPPDPPAMPLNVTVERVGHRRVIRWQNDPQGKPADSYRVERSVLRPGRPGDPLMTLLPTCMETVFTDAEILHSGEVVSYVVRSVARGRVEVAGRVLQDADRLSIPAASEPMLVWYEVSGLRCLLVQPDGAADGSAASCRALHWHTPAGVRQIALQVLERLPDGTEQPVGVEILLPPQTREWMEPADRSSTDGDGDALPPGERVYRLRCLYDGVGGDFWTPGVTIAGVAWPPASGLSQGHPAGDDLTPAGRNVTAGIDPRAETAGVTGQTGVADREPPAEASRATTTDFPVAAGAELSPESAANGNAATEQEIPGIDANLVEPVKPLHRLSIWPPAANS